MPARLQRLITDQSGQALPEFALVLPLLLVLLFGVIDFGRAVNYWNDATHISAEGARYAVVNRKPITTGAGAGLSLQQQLQGQGDTGELRSGGTATLPTPGQVCISFPNTSSLAGDPVQVNMTFTYHWLPFLSAKLGILTSTVNASSVMRLETAPTVYTAGCA